MNLKRPKGQSRCLGNSIKASATGKDTQRSALKFGMVQMSQVKEQVFVDLSSQFAQQIKDQRQDLAGLSFFCEEGAKQQRLELSKLINRLKGNWKISFNAETTNFIVVDQIRLDQRKDKIPEAFQKVAEEVLSKARNFASSNQSLKPIQRAKANSGVGVLSVPHCTLKGFLPDVNMLPKYGRQILVDDLMHALHFLESQHAHFHVSRMKTLFLERDQVKPNTYSENGGFFVVSKIIMDSDKNMARVYDLSTRQVFHQLDKLTVDDDGRQVSTPGGTTPGVSPVKSRVQVAMAQAQNETKHAKASPVGSLLKGKLLNAAHLARRMLLQPYDYHTFERDIPNGYCPCTTRAEKKYAIDNFTKIEKLRAKETAKDKQRHIEANHDFGVIGVPQLEPIPHENHTYCQICNETYEDYIKHITQSKTHHKLSRTQNGPFKEIDEVFQQLNKKRKWETNWVTDPQPQMPDIVPSSQLSMIHSQIDGPNSSAKKVRSRRSYTPQKIRRYSQNTIEPKPEIKQFERPEDLYPENVNQDSISVQKSREPCFNGKLATLPDSALQFRNQEQDQQEVETQNVFQHDSELENDDQSYQVQKSEEYSSSQTDEASVKELIRESLHHTKLHSVRNAEDTHVRKQLHAFDPEDSKESERRSQHQNNKAQAIEDKPLNTDSSAQKQCQQKELSEGDSPDKANRQGKVLAEMIYDEEESYSSDHEMTPQNFTMPFQIVQAKNQQNQQESSQKSVSKDRQIKILSPPKELLQMTPQMDQAKGRSKYFSMHSFDAQQSESNVPSFKRSESKAKHCFSKDEVMSRNQAIESIDFGKILPGSAPMSAKGHSKKQSEHIPSVALSALSEKKESPEKQYCVSEEENDLQDLNFQCYMEAVDYEFDKDNGNMVPKCLIREVESTPTEDKEYLEKQAFDGEMSEEFGEELIAACLSDDSDERPEQRHSHLKEMSVKDEQSIHIPLAQCDLHSSTQAFRAGSLNGITQINRGQVDNEAMQVQHVDQIDQYHQQKLLDALCDKKREDSMLFSCRDDPISVESEDKYSQKRKQSSAWDNSEKFSNVDQTFEPNQKSAKSNEEQTFGQQTTEKQRNNSQEIPQADCVAHESFCDSQHRSLLEGEVVSKHETVGIQALRQDKLQTDINRKFEQLLFGESSSARSKPQTTKKVESKLGLKSHKMDSEDISLSRMQLLGPQSIDNSEDHLATTQFSSYNKQSILSRNNAQKTEKQAEKQFQSQAHAKIHIQKNEPGQNIAKSFQACMKKRYNRFGAINLQTKTFAYKSNKSPIINRPPEITQASNMLKRRTHNEAFSKQANKAVDAKPLGSKDKRARHGQISQGERTLFE